MKGERRVKCLASEEKSIRWWKGGSASSEVSLGSQRGVWTERGVERWGEGEEEGEGASGWFLLEVVQSGVCRLCTESQSNLVSTRRAGRARVRKSLPLRGRRQPMASTSPLIAVSVSALCSSAALLLSEAARADDSAEHTQAGEKQR